MAFLGGNRLARTITITFELSKWIFFLVIFLALVHFFIATIFMVEGISMEPNFHTGQVVMVNKIAYLLSSPARGDTVVLRYPGDPDHAKYIKRIVGLPGEKVAISNGKILINGQELLEVYLPVGTLTESDNYTQYTLKDNEYWLVGDNRLASSDSRIWGPATKQDLIGRTRFILYPFSTAGYVPNVYYK